MKQKMSLLLIRWYTTVCSVFIYDVVHPLYTCQLSWIKPSSKCIQNLKGLPPTLWQVLKFITLFYETVICQKSVFKLSYCLSMAIDTTEVSISEVLPHVGGSVQSTNEANKHAITGMVCSKRPGILPCTLHACAVIGSIYIALAPTELVFWLQSKKWCLIMSLPCCCEGPNISKIACTWKIPALWNGLGYFNHNYFGHRDDCHRAARRTIGRVCQHRRSDTIIVPLAGPYRGRPRVATRHQDAVGSLRRPGRPRPGAAFLRRARNHRAARDRGQPSLPGVAGRSHASPKLRACLGSRVSVSYHRGLIRS